MVGCGQIAGARFQEIRHIACAEFVAVCDRHVDLARQAAARFEAPAYFDDLD
jgi:predicted dehydrogenase